MKKKTKREYILDRVNHAIETMENIPEAIYDTDLRLVCVLNQLRIIRESLADPIFESQKIVVKHSSKDGQVVFDEEKYIKYLDEMSKVSFDIPRNLLYGRWNHEK